MQQDFPSFIRDRVAELVYGLATERERSLWQELEDRLSHVNTDTSRPAGTWSPSRHSHAGSDHSPSRHLSPVGKERSVSDFSLRGSWATTGRNANADAPHIGRQSSLGSSVESRKSSHETQDIDLNYLYDTQLTYRPDLRKILEARERQKRNGYRGMRTSGLFDTTTGSNTVMLRNGDKKRQCLFHPDGQWRGITELCTIIALLHDSIVIPFVMAWNIDDSLGISIGMMASLSIWTVDIFMNFTTGFYKSDGEIEMGRYRVACRYLRSTFFIDLSIAGIDWFSRITEWILGGSARGGSMAVLRLARIARLGRLVRILNFPRLLKLYSRFLSTRGAALSTAWTVVFQAFQILAGILWINHFSSCVWFAIGRLVKEGGFDSDTGETWLDISVGTLDITYYRVGILFQYTTCMHWSMTQMTPGSMAVTPRNSFERLWNIVCLVFGLLFGTSLVGQLSSKMVQFNMSRQVEMRRMETLRRLLRENAISAELSGKVQRRIMDRMNVKTRLCEQDVEDLKHLPGNLRTLLRHTMYVHHFVKHPLFAAWKLYDPNMLMFICSTGGLAFECVSAGDECFSPGVESDRAYLVLEGAMGYTYADKQDGEEVDAPVLTRDVVGKGYWICEVSLWFEWNYLGSLEAQSPCEMMTITSEAIAFGLKHCAKIEELTFQWVHGVAKHVSVVLHRSHHGGQEKGMNLELMFTFGAVALLMSEEARVMLAKCALDVTTTERPSPLLRTRSKKHDEDAEGEVEDGKSVLCIDGAGTLVRTVPLVVLRITRQDRRVLVMLARGVNIGSSGPSTLSMQACTSEGVNQAQLFFWKPVCKLPGKKVRVGEDPVEVVKTYIEDEMPNCHHLIARVSDTAVCTDVRVVPSTTYHIKSYYHRTIIDIVLDEMQEAILEDRMSDFEADFLENVPVLSGMDIQITEGVDGSAHLYSWLLPEELSHMEDGRNTELMDAIKGLNMRRYTSSGASRSKELASMGSLQQRRVRSVASDLATAPPPLISVEEAAVSSRGNGVQQFSATSSPQSLSPESNANGNPADSDVHAHNKTTKNFSGSNAASLEPAGDREAASLVEPHGDSQGSGVVLQEVKPAAQQVTRLYAHV